LYILSGFHLYISVLFLVNGLAQHTHILLLYKYTKQEETKKTMSIIVICVDEDAVSNAVLCSLYWYKHDHTIHAGVTAGNAGIYMVI
jgi:hypothetical protein